MHKPVYILVYSNLHDKKKKTKTKTKKHSITYFCYTTCVYRRHVMRAVIG